jgi:hypothetical protein
VHLTTPKHSAHIERTSHHGISIRKPNGEQSNPGMSQNSRRTMCNARGLMFIHCATSSSTIPVVVVARSIEQSATICPDLFGSRFEVRVSAPALACTLSTNIYATQHSRCLRSSSSCSNTLTTSYTFNPSVPPILRKVHNQHIDLVLIFQRNSHRTRMNSNIRNTTHRVSCRRAIRFARTLFEHTVASTLPHFYSRYVISNRIKRIN